jgi:hypothetical protein
MRHDYAVRSALGANGHMAHGFQTYVNNSVIGQTKGAYPVGENDWGTHAAEGRCMTNGVSTPGGAWGQTRRPHAQRPGTASALPPSSGRLPGACAKACKTRAAHGHDRPLAVLGKLGTPAG